MTTATCMEEGNASGCLFGLDGGLGGILFSSLLEFASGTVFIIVVFTLRDASPFNIA